MGRCSTCHVVLIGFFMRSYMKLVVLLMVGVSLFASAQEVPEDKNSIEAKITFVTQNVGTVELAVQRLLSSQDTTLSDAQKNAIAALPEVARVLFVSTIVSGTDTIDSALIASTQDGVTAEMGQNLIDAFSPQLVDFDDEDREGSDIETAAGPGSVGPIGIGVGAGGSGGGGVVASSN